MRNAASRPTHFVILSAQVTPALDDAVRMAALRAPPPRAPTRTPGTKRLWAFALALAVSVALAALAPAARALHVRAMPRTLQTARARDTPSRSAASTDGVSLILERGRAAATVAAVAVPPRRRVVIPVAMAAPLTTAAGTSPSLFWDAFLVGSEVLMVGEEYDYQWRLAANVSVAVGADDAPFAPLASALHTGNGNAFVWTTAPVVVTGAPPPTAVGMRVRAQTPHGLVNAALRVEQSTHDAPPGDRATVGMCAIMYPSDVHLLAAWAPYWEALGVDEFFLYWRGDPARLIDVEAAVSRLSRAAVTFIQWGAVSRLPQQVSLNSCYRRFSRAHSFLLNYDLDEYLVLPRGETLPSFFGGLPPTWAALVTDSRWAEVDFAALNTTWDALDARHWARATLACVAALGRPRQVDGTHGGRARRRAARRRA